MAPTNDTPKPSHLWAGVNLQGLTWGDLRAFVEICRDVPDDVEIGMDYDDNYEVTGLRECIPTVGGVHGG